MHVWACLKWLSGYTSEVGIHFRGTSGGTSARHENQRSLHFRGSCAAVRVDRPGGDRAYWRGGGCACHTRGRSTVWRTARPSHGIAGKAGWTAPLHGELSVVSRVGGPCRRGAADRPALARRPPGSGASLLLGHDVAAGRTH